MTRVVSTKSNAPFKRYVRANRRKIGLVADVRDATRFNNHCELVKVLARVDSILPSCYFEYEELVPPVDDGERRARERRTRLRAVTGHGDHA
jgi:hypothetical protein